MAAVITFGFPANLRARAPFLDAALLALDPARILPPDLEAARQRIHHVVGAGLPSHLPVRRAESWLAELDALVVAIDEERVRQYEMAAAVELLRAVRFAVYAACSSPARVLQQAA